MITCQICGRQIKDNTGVIAHHGYQRPGEGWQTSSCFGARYPAYEISHDRLDQWMTLLETWIPQRETALAIYKEVPPDQYEVGPKDSAGRFRWSKVVTKPDNLDTSTSPATFAAYSYESEFWFRVHEMERDIRGMKYELDRARQRRKAWKPLFPITRAVPIPC